LAPVSIVIVAYNSGDHLSRCLAALGSGRGDVVVVDNASPGEEAALVRDRFPHVRLIERPRNDGFGSAANAGVAVTRSRWVLLLNPDAWPIDDALERLVAFAEGEPGLGATGPLLCDAAGRPQRSIIKPPLTPAALAAWAAFPGAVSRLYGTLRKAARRGVGAGEFLQGSALLVRRDAFEAVGGFDESFFMYGEDADLCARLRDAGWTVTLCRGAGFVHVGGGSTAEDAERMHLELLRSWIRLIAKRKGIREAERARRRVLLAMRVRAFGSRAPRQRAAAAWLASGGVGELLGPPE
jgi:N-acetylglucosaminyl-diphospho-decaprenol L-rhamnosyltransferase